MSKTSTLVRFQDRVEQVHAYFRTCRDNLAMVYRTMFPLNPQPNSLPQIMEKFKNPAEVQKLVRNQLIAGAEVAFAFVQDVHPMLNLTIIATRDGVNLAHLARRVTDAALIVVQRLEEGEAMHLQSTEEVQS